MEEYGQFQTQTEPKWYAWNTALFTLTAALAASVALWFFTKAVESVWMVAVMGTVACVVMLLVMKKRAPVLLSFQGSSLYISDAGEREYQIRNVSAGNFVLRQSKLEAKTNVGRLVIKNKGLSFYGVKDFEKLGEYIQKNFPQ